MGVDGNFVIAGTLWAQASQEQACHEWCGERARQSLGLNKATDIIAKTGANSVSACLIRASVGVAAQHDLACSPRSEVFLALRFDTLCLSVPQNQQEKMC